ncbi:MAG: hypothetical protein PHZ00_01775 [Candidatus Peribacteraceae bacterium]|nr:hypothetical protein [Candidatus Peribacteraceae bacterium]
MFDGIAVNVGESGGSLRAVTDKLIVVAFLPSNPMIRLLARGGFRTAAADRGGDSGIISSCGNDSYSNPSLTLIRRWLALRPPSSSRSFSPPL